MATSEPRLIGTAAIAARRGVMPTPEDRFFNLIHAKLTLQEPEDLVASVRNLRRGDSDPLNLGRKLTENLKTS